MGLSFLPAEIKQAISHLNLNYLTEIRIRKGQPVIIGYSGEYYYLDNFGKSDDSKRAIVGGNLEQLINAATGGSIFSYNEQIRRGFITCEHGVRIGLAGEYVMENGRVNTVAGITSVNIRIPHDVVGCADIICSYIAEKMPKSLLIYSKPGLGKTTKLRDIARFLSNSLKLNVLVFDERNEISATDGHGNGFDLGHRVDVIRSGTKEIAFERAVRAMKPDAIITDELYGDSDLRAVKFVADCGIMVIASSHITDVQRLKEMPFEYFVELKSLYGQPIIYDKDFNTCCTCGVDDLNRCVPLGE